MSLQLRGLCISALMVLTAVFAYVMTPTQVIAADAVALEQMIPRRFGDWVQQEDTVIQVPAEVARPGAAGSDRPLYDQVLMRTYRRQSDGESVMLTLAYGRRQVQEFKIHRPELCYYSQGYDVRFMGRSDVPLGGAMRVASNRLLTRNRARFEPVTYWIRIGHQISLSPWETRWLIFKDALAGSVPDGILVRASSVVQAEADSESAFQLQKLFFADLYNSLSPEAKYAIVGG